LQWSTASETNSDHFDLERSADGNTFEFLKRVDAAGFSSVQNNYLEFDESPFSTKTYYRLKQFDYNGSSNYSNIVLIENENSNAAVVNIHPNPSTGDVYFDFLSGISGTLRIELFDYTGRLINTEVVTVSQGRTALKASLAALSEGIYTLKVDFNNGTYSSVSKLIRQ
jgi:hypothetical protein